MPTYAANTTVSSDASVAEIKRTVIRYGASQFAYMESDEQSMIAFVIQGRQVRFQLTMPSRTAKEFTHHSRGLRTDEAAEKLYEQAVRQRWRALALVVKAKLEAVESGIVTFEQEFGMHMVLPNGQSVHEVVTQAIDQAYVDGGPIRLQIEAR